MPMPRLLIVKTSSLGDVIHNLPVIADIRAHVPDIVIDWVVEENFADIPALHPAVSNVIPVAVRRWRKKLFTRNTWHEMSVFRKRLTENRYDWVLDTQGLLKSALITSFAHGEKHGHDRGSAREPLASLFYGYRHAVARGQHAVTRNRQLAALALGYAMPETLPDYGIRPTAGSLPAGLPERYIVGLHATSRDSKLWPMEHWITLGKHLSERGLSLLLPWGNEDERTRAATISASVPNAIVLPRLRLGELAAVLANAVASVGVDTGLIHLAVALDVPAVAIYTDTDPLLTGVFGAHPECSINIGGIGQSPSCDDVRAALDRIIPA
jgi:heptosyltransferase I